MTVHAVSVTTLLAAANLDPGTFSEPMRYDIGRQPNPHFGVDTPYLAAVVKGTVFSITVAEEGATLQVTEGAVETSTIDGGARDLILPGSVAMVAAGDDRRLIVETDGRRAHEGDARFNSDRDRDQRLGMAGWAVFRFTGEQVFDRPEQTVDRVTALLRAAAGGRG